MGDQAKDRWDKAKIVSETLLALVGLAFTIVYGLANFRLARSNSEISRSQLEISRSQVTGAFVPSLSSQDPKQRAIAIALAEALDKSFAAQVAAILATKDDSQEVRATAGSTLSSLATTAEGKVQQTATSALRRFDVMNELRDKNLLGKLDEARGYQAAGSPTATETAVVMYRDVVKQLSPEARRKLDQRLLTEAEKDYAAGHIDAAALKYRVLLVDYGQAGRVYVIYQEAPFEVFYACKARTREEASAWEES